MLINVDDIPTDIYKIPSVPLKGLSFQSRARLYDGLFVSHPERDPWINEVFGWCPQCNCLIPLNYNEIPEYYYTCPNRPYGRRKTYVMSHAYAIFRSTNCGDKCHFSVVDSSISGFDELMSDFKTEHPHLFPPDINDIEYYGKRRSHVGYDNNEESSRHTA